MTAPFIPADFSSAAIDLAGKSVLITGGTGSFGQHFVRKTLGRGRPRRLAVFSRDEVKQWEMAEALKVWDRGTLRITEQPAVREEEEVQA